MSRADRDSFAEDNLPPPAEWSDLDLSNPTYAYPERLNATVELLDRWVEERDWGDRRCLITEAATWSYRALYERVNRLAHVLVDDLGLLPGNRVLLRAPNTPMMVCAYLAVIKAGGIAVGTMPLLRAGELTAIIEKAEIGLALSDARLAEELVAAATETPVLRRIAYFATAVADGIEAMMAAKPSTFEAYDSPADETCLIAFTSGTTGAPKGTMHFHRDLLSICRGASGLILEPTPEDLFAGTPPLAFTFGLGGLALFPLYAGAASFLI